MRYMAWLFKNTIFINFCHSLNTIRGYTDHRIKEKTGAVQEGRGRGTGRLKAEVIRMKMYLECGGPESI